MGLAPFLFLKNCSQLIPLHKYFFSRCSKVFLQTSLPNLEDI